VDWKELFSDAYQPVLLVSGTLSGAKLWLDLRKARRELKPKDSQIVLATQDEVSRNGTALYGLLAVCLLGGALYPLSRDDPKLVAGIKGISPASAPSYSVAIGASGSSEPASGGDAERDRRIAAALSASSGRAVNAAVRQGPYVAPPDPVAIASQLFQKGNEAYLRGDVREGIRMMQDAERMGAPGAHERLCAIYRTPKATQGRDPWLASYNCKGV